MDARRCRELFKNLNKIVGLIEPSSSDSGTEGKNEEDWAEVYTTFLTHTSLSYDDIGRRSIPQIEAIMKRLGKHVSLGIPFSFGGSIQASETTTTKEINKPGETPCIDDIISFCNGFGVGG